MSKETAARLAVRDSLIQLVDINRSFREAVENDQHLPVWIMDQPNQSDTQSERSMAAECSTRLTYCDSQNKQETARLTGLVGISEQTLELGKTLNAVRTEFKSTMSDFRKLFGDSIDIIEQTSDDLRDSVLGGLKIQHIHFVQSYRQLKIFSDAPERVGFSWAASHSGSVRLTAEEAVDHFKRKYILSSAISNDIQTLEQMPAGETVVIKRNLAPHLRANITWSKKIQTLRLSDPDLKKQYPAQINSPLPLFIKLNPGEPLPEFNRIRPFDPAAKQERLRRSDARLIKISENPHSRIYRYA